MIRPPPRSTLFPYPPLFRSHGVLGLELRAAHLETPLALEPLQVRLDRLQKTLDRGGRGGASPSEPGVALLLRVRSEEHTSELQSQSNLVCRLLLENKNITIG